MMKLVLVCVFVVIFCHFQPANSDHAGAANQNSDYVETPGILPQSVKMLRSKLTPHVKAISDELREFFIPKDVDQKFTKVVEGIRNTVKDTFEKLVQGDPQNAEAAPKS